MANEQFVMDTTSTKVKELTNQKKDINKQLDNLLYLQIARGADQRLIDKENQLKYRLEKLKRNFKVLLMIQVKKVMAKELNLESFE